MTNLDRYRYLSPEDRRQEIMADDVLEFERLKFQVWAAAHLRDYKESLTPEAIEAGRNRANTLAKEARELAERGTYLPAIECMRDAYALDRSSRMKHALQQVYVQYGMALLAVELWESVIQTLSPLKREGIASGAIHYLLAMAYNMGFRIRGRREAQPLKDAISEAKEAIIMEPGNAYYFAEIAESNANTALWWKGARYEFKYIGKYQQEAIRQLVEAYRLGSQDDQLLEKIRGVVIVLKGTGDLCQQLPIRLLQDIGLQQQEV